MWDTGDILATEDLRLFHDYEVKNCGNQPLIIRKIHTDCDCVNTEYKREPIATGEVTTIRVEFAPTRKLQLDGRFSHSVFVETNDKVSPFVELKLNGKIDQDRKSVV